MADMIKKLKAMDDAAILTQFGFDKKVTKFKEDLERGDKLTGDARDKLNETLEKAFQPSTYVIEDLGWQIDRAEKKAKCGPTDFVNSCGCADHID